MTPANTNEKAQRRRQQVKRAQVRHRQRKADYTKQLELDAVRLRQLVAETEDQTKVLRRQNDEMRRCLRDVEATSQETDIVAWLDAPTAVKDGQMMVSLGFHDAVGTPCLQMEAGPGGSLLAADVDCEAPTSPELIEQRAVNFILALEHICWDHFNHDEFENLDDVLLHDPKTIDPDHGHTLMASAYLMASAPASVYASLEALTPGPAWRRLLFPDSSRRRRDASPVLRWSAPGLSLASLHGLAQSLNPLGDVELTPVQAWFELSVRYPSERLLRADVMDALLRRFRGVVRCVAYGAAVERLAFESVVAGVLGPAEPLAV
ncbi:hypothetical protein XA68_15068 [Ophiocordyceps unilateralis]|uniref:BZIP domain-containing protein n=1 Tax=Ophiocordyceps unilateralis TaxID=268505 RepID=A0A2A9PMI1_OPHUN|nr:hypothetical protein XA68_15068 [Ophiocordyceps unilateralis]